MQKPWLLPVVGALVLMGGARSSEAEPGTITGGVSAKPAKYRAGIVVYLEKVPGTHRPPAKPVQIDQKGMTFIPHILPVVRGTSVAFLNSDSVRHNVFSPDGEKYDLGTWPQGERKAHTFNKAGVYRQLCNVHPEMSAFIVVLDNPYFAVTGEDGVFSIAGVPPGTYTMHAWSEKLAQQTQKVTVADGGTTKVTLSLKK